MPRVLLSFLVTTLMINYKMYFLVITNARVTSDISITLKVILSLLHIFLSSVYNILLSIIFSMELTSYLNNLCCIQKMCMAKGEN